MKRVQINGLFIYHTSNLELFKQLLHLNGATKKGFAMKFELSYAYVNSWGSRKGDKIKKFPSWVFHYLKDVTFYKVATIKQCMMIEQINERLNNQENLSDLYKLISNPIHIGAYDPLTVHIEDEKILINYGFEQNIDNNIV